MGSETYLTERWVVDPTEGDATDPGKNAEIMTADKAVHIAYVGQPFADHIVELHNRTLGDGQEPPPASAGPVEWNRVPRGVLGRAHEGENRWVKELRRALDNAAQDVAENTPGGHPAYSYLDRERPGPCTADDIRRAYIAGYQQAQADRALRDGEKAAKDGGPLTVESRSAMFEAAAAELSRNLGLPGRRIEVNERVEPRTDDIKRLPNVLQRTEANRTTAAGMEFRYRLTWLVNAEVERRLEALIEESPITLANRLVQLGWHIEPPADPAELERMQAEDAREAERLKPIIEKLEGMQP